MQQQGCPEQIRRTAVHWKNASFKHSDLYVAIVLRECGRARGNGTGTYDRSEERKTDPCAERYRGRGQGPLRNFRGNPHLVASACRPRREQRLADSERGCRERQTFLTTAGGVCERSCLGGERGRN